jgi:hypothetical protein
MAWKELLKKPYLSQKPQLSQGLATHAEDRELEMAYKNLRDLEDHCKKLYKEVRRHEECANGLHRLERKMSSDLSNSPLCREYDDAEDLRKMAEAYQSVVYQLGHATGDLTQLSQKTVVEPMKKLTAEFGAIAAAIKKRDSTLTECLKCQGKLEKLAKLEKTAGNIAKIEQSKRAYLTSKEDFDSQNRLLLLELPQFYEKRVDYFQPCLQALIRAQVDYYGESTRLFTHLVSTNNRNTFQSNEEYHDELDKNLSAIRSLSIVGN